MRRGPFTNTITWAYLQTLKILGVYKKTLKIRLKNRWVVSNGSRVYAHGG